MYRNSLACTLALTTCLALAQQGRASESASDLAKFVPAPPPAGAYLQDKAHSSLTLRVDHLGFSHFTARFARFDIQLQLDPAHLNASRVTTRIDPNSFGVTRPVVLDGTFNGGYSGHPMDPHARVGFSAHGSFKRSDFGVSFGLPAPGTKFGVGDEIEVTIETELSGPAYRAAQG
jgi:polyisoprenoid-binding protein YceI